MGAVAIVAFIDSHLLALLPFKKGMVTIRAEVFGFATSWVEREQVTANLTS